MSARLAGVMVGMLFAVAAVPAVAQSLGDVARQEAQRREQVKSTGKVLTNADLPPSAVVAPPGAPATEGARATADGSPGDTTAPQPEGARPAMAPKAEGEAAKKAPTDDEDGWRARAERVNTALAAARAQVRQLKALSDRLSLEAQASNPTIAARASDERADLRAQIAQAEAKEAAAQAERDTLVQEARVSGVPPAWIQ